MEGVAMERGGGWETARESELLAMAEAARRAEVAGVGWAVGMAAAVGAPTEGAEERARAEAPATLGEGWRVGAVGPEVVGRAWAAMVRAGAVAPAVVAALAMVASMAMVTAAEAAMATSAVMAMATAAEVMMAMVAVRAMAVAVTGSVDTETVGEAGVGWAQERVVVVRAPVADWAVAEMGVGGRATGAGPTGVTGVTLAEVLAEAKGAGNPVAAKAAAVAAASGRWAERGVKMGVIADWEAKGAASGERAADWETWAEAHSRKKCHPAAGDGFLLPGLDSCRRAGQPAGRWQRVARVCQ